MQAETRTLTQLFALDVRYLVPLYQRPYVWTEERQWAPLWDDISTVANHMLVDAAGVQPPTHFLGAIVIHQQENAPGTPQRFMVIDGQQRLTTLQLLLSAAAIAAEELGSENEGRLLRDLTVNDPSLAEGEERFKVWPTNANRHAFRLAMTVDGGSAPDDPTNEIQEGHAFFRSAILEWATEDGADDDEIARRLKALRITTRELLKLVAIRLEDGDNPQVIFETLNARGTPLIALDLLKNAVFLAAEHQGANTDDLYHDHWQPELDLDYWRKDRRAGRLFTKNGDLFLSYWLVAELAEPVPATELFETFRDKVLQPADAAPMETLIPALCVDAETVRGFDAADSNSPKRRFFDQLELLDTTTVMPIALILYRSAELTEARRTRAVQILESFLVRRMICGWTAKNYNRLFASLVPTLRSDVANADDVLEAALAAETAPTNRWPRDRDIHEAVRDKDMYNQRRQDRLVMVLWRIEERLRALDPKIEQGVPAPPKLTLEHLIPQTWEPHWPLDATKDDPVQWRSAHMHRLGNLTLTSGPMNSALSNGPWHAPEQLNDKQRLLRGSVLVVNQRVAAEYPTSFDEAAVDARGESLADAIVAIWPGPGDHIDDQWRISEPEAAFATQYEGEPPAVDAGPPPAPVTSTTLIPRGATFSSKLEFEAAVRRWYDQTDESTVGDAVNYSGVTTWIRVLTAGLEIQVHADTTREAVGRYLALVSELGPELVWHIRHGRRGTLNKVCIEPDGRPTKGLFMYTAEPQTEPLDV